MNALCIQRPPVSHLCGCGRRNILIFPDAPGALTWHCVCGNQWQLPFRVNEGEEFMQTDVGFERIPMDHGCGCGRRDIIVLPMGRGELRWMCEGETVEDGASTPCRKTWKLVFNEKSGEIYEV